LERLPTEQFRRLHRIVAVRDLGVGLVDIAFRSTGR
jgi:hypothetical protein